MQGKRGLIMGLANDRSLAWGIARARRATRAPSSPSPTRARRSKSACARWRRSLVRTCSSTATSRDMKALDKTFDALKERWDTLDFVVHAIGYSDKNELRGKFVDTSMDNFLMTMNISVYSFVAVAQRARAMMSERRIAADADLLRRREGHPALQCDGRCQGRRSKHRSNISRWTSGPRASASTASRPARSRRSRRAVSATSATS